ncbi:UBA/THIF-type NAD/FAD binding protein [Corchorus capsularis]|uniref:UBA/THIF-type NAD/FAD binding protein n=1 Tax=Corchorus capsularis TaxID=210143 RepID=A0A1R3ITX8_COCAP|nr:UBA/THIF-type NAD/FAD binding protein [Corchorus capsularis]
MIPSYQLDTRGIATLDKITNAAMPHDIVIFQVYLTLCAALIASAVGVYLYILFNVGGNLTFFSCLGTIIGLSLTPSHQEGKRVTFDGSCNNLALLNSFSPKRERELPLMVAAISIPGPEKELLVAIKHVLGTDFKRSLFPLIDALLEERVLVGTWCACYETSPAAMYQPQNLLANIFVPSERTHVPQLNFLPSNPPALRNTDQCWQPTTLGSQLYLDGVNLNYLLGMIGTMQPPSPTQSVSAQPAAVPSPPPPTVQTVDTSRVLAYLKPVITTLTRLFIETSHALAGTYLNLINSLYWLLLRKRACEGEVVEGESENNNNSNNIKQVAVTSPIKKHRIVATAGTDLMADNNLAVYGRDTMRRLFASNVLISGMQCLGAEIVCTQCWCSSLNDEAVLFEFDHITVSEFVSCFYNFTENDIKILHATKNLILAGVKSVILHDEGVVELWDLSSNFVFSENDVSKKRALASVQMLQELNNAVVISTFNNKVDQ